MEGERYQAPECLFQPRLVDVEQPGIAGPCVTELFDDLMQSVAELIFQVVQAAPLDIRGDLYKQVLLSGGSTMYPGLPNRLEKELKQLYLTHILKGDVTKLNVS